MLKKSVVCIFFIAALFAGAGLAGAVPKAAKASESKKASSQRSYIIREVRHELLMLPRYSLFDWIEFEVQPDDSVILRGQVRGLTLKKDAEDAVRTIDGVTKVINQIEDLPVSPSDDQIRRRAYRAIYAEDGPLFRYAIEVVPTIHIIVKNGNLTLKGVVDSQADSDYAYTKARGLSQVFSVKNELKVEKP